MGLIARILFVGLPAVLASAVLISPALAPRLGPAWSSSTVATDAMLPPSDPPLRTQVRDPVPTAAADLSVGLRIAIPRLGIDLPIELGDIARDVPRNGFTGATPEHAALLFPGTSVPGQGGNSYIYAHARVGMFLSLWSVRLGDVVVVARADGSVVRTYSVGLVAPRVDPSDTHWLDDSGPERLTLQTSTGPSPTDPRFIAVAYPTETAASGSRP